MEIQLPKPRNSTFVALDLSGLRCPHSLFNDITAVRAPNPEQNIQICAAYLNALPCIEVRLRRGGNRLINIDQEAYVSSFCFEIDPKDIDKIEEE